MRLLGYSQWTKATVAAVELGRRSIDREELHALALVLGTSVADLEDFDFETPGGAVITRKMQSDAASGKGLASGAWVDAGRDWPDDAEIKAAARLGMPPEKLRSLAVSLWGHSLSQERERRLGDVAGLSQRSAQARRGHITRQLLVELAAGPGRRKTKKTGEKS